MELSIQRWGNSAALRLPKAFLELAEASLSIGDKVSVEKKGNSFVITPVATRPKLADLLAKITPENHHEDLFDRPMGNEII